MKRFAQLALVASLVAGLSLFVAGCGKEEEKKTGASGDTPIANTTQGTQAASSTSQNVDTAMNSGESFDSLGSIGLSSTVGAPGFKAGEIMSAATTTHTCSNGGSYIFNGEANKAALTANGDFIFNNCAMDNRIYNGPMHLDATASLGLTSSTVTMALSLGTTGQFSITGDDGIEWTMNNFELTIDRQYSNTNQTFSNTRTIKATGSMSASDGVKTVTTSFSDNFTQTVENNISGGTGTKTITTSGMVSVAGPARTVTTSFSNFKIEFNATTSYTDVSINGTFTIVSGSCFDGTFSLVTNTPVRVDTTGTTIDGQIVINGATTMTFKADGSVDVTTGGQTTNYASIDDIDVCPL